MLWNCLYRSNILYIIIAEWSRSWVQIRRRLLLNVTEISFWKSYFYEKMIFICFLYIHICHMLLFFIIKVFRLDLRKFIQLWWATLSINRPCLFPEMYVFTLVRKRGVICAVYFTHIRCLPDIFTWNASSQRFLQFFYFMCPLSGV